MNATTLVLRGMQSLIAAIVLLVASNASAQPIGDVGPPDGRRVVIVALHEVDDGMQQLPDDGVLSERLVALFEWLTANGWTAVSLDDIERAGRGETRLPDRAVLITVDDGYRSLYTRVFPLALAYRMPIVAAVVGSWLDAPADGTVRYGTQQVPRSHFITWAEAREMQASGLVEFASHSYDLHHDVQANPQGNRRPAAAALIWSPTAGYENDDAYRARITADLLHARERMRAELGRVPRALAWPYGANTRTAREAAVAAGFQFALTLTPEPADAAMPMSLARFIPSRDIELDGWVANLRFNDPWRTARRIVQVDPATLSGPDATTTNDRLGKAINRLLVLGATDIVLDAAVESADGRLEAAWFPTRELPMREDLLSRIATQMRTRAGVNVIVRLPHLAALRTLNDTDRVLRLFHELGEHVTCGSLMVEDVPSLTIARVAANEPPWTVRARRHTIDRQQLPADDLLALRAFEEVEDAHPELELVWLAPRDHPLTALAAVAEMTLVPFDPANGRGRPPSLDVVTSRRAGVWWSSETPWTASELTAAVRRFQIGGGRIVGWTPDDPVLDRPDAESIAPTVSAARFPPRSKVAP
ncbi:poly-beta-1,6-N-acetyl-D-glucosamine N-deacetylase PgaB [Lysobacter sp. HA18]